MSDVLPTIWASRDYSGVGDIINQLLSVGVPLTYSLGLFGALRLFFLNQCYSMMRNMCVHGVRLIYLESSPIHTDHCGQQNNPNICTTALILQVLWGQKESFMRFLSQCRSFTELYWFSRKHNKHISYRPGVPGVYDRVREHITQFANGQSQFIHKMSIQRQIQVKTYANQDNSSKSSLKSHEG